MSEHFFGAGVSASSYIHEWTSLQRGNALPETNQFASSWWSSLFEAKAKIALPAAYPTHLNYQQLINQRQSLREYADCPVNLADLATFLEHASRPLNPATKPLNLLAPLVLNPTIWPWVAMFIIPLPINWPYCAPPIRWSHCNAIAFNVNFCKHH